MHGGAGYSRGMTEPDRLLFTDETVAREPRPIARVIAAVVLSLIAILVLVAVVSAVVRSVA